MSDKNTTEMDEMLSEYYRGKREGTVRFHRDQTHECPSIPRLLTGWRNNWKDWSERERWHVSGCRFCEKNIEIAFSEQCPKRLELAEHRAETSVTAAALDAHLSDCVKCARRIRSWHVEQLAGFLKARKLSRESIAARAEQMSFGTGSWARAGVMGEPQELFQAETLSDDQCLRTEIFETRSQELRVRVESRNQEDKGRRVRFTLRGADGTVLAGHDLTLQEDEGRSSVTMTIGSFAEFNPELRDYEFGCEWLTV